MDFSTLSALMEPCDINGLINDTIAYLSTQSRFDDIKIRFNPSTRAIFTRSDIGQLQQLLYNLIYNSADAVKDKLSGDEKRIEITAQMDGDEKNFSISVEDNGTGISDEYMDIAFKERFTTKKAGHGLGLMVCKRIIENHKGHLKIKSKSGEGTLISIRMPISEVVAEEPVPA